MQLFSTGQNTEQPRIKPTLWIGIAAVAFYVLLAAGLGTLINILFPTGSDVADYALSRFIPLPIAIACGLLFTHWAGWSNATWRIKPFVSIQKPRRRWLYAIPVLLLFQALSPLFTASWNDISVTLFIVALLACLLVGIGEELYFRGIVRVSIKPSYGVFVPLFVTSLLFGLGHTAGELFDGLGFWSILFNVVALSAAGALHYGAFLATGRLWVPIALHFLTDFGLRLSGSFGTTSDATVGVPSIIAQVILWGLAVALVISALRDDRKTKEQRKNLLHTTS